MTFSFLLGRFIEGNKKYIRNALNEYRTNGIRNLFLSSMRKICIVRNVLFLLSMIDKIRRISVYWYFDRYSIDILFLHQPVPSYT